MDKHPFKKMGKQKYKELHGQQGQNMGSVGLIKKEATQTL